MIRALVIAGLLALGGCGQPSRGDEAAAEMAVSMRAEADMVRRGVGLQEIFDGQCTADCSGHRAGYLWALDNEDVRFADDCDPGAGQSFAEGCRRGVRAAAFQ